MKNRKMISKMISNKDEAIGSDFKPYILSNTITKLCILLIILIGSLILINDVNKLAFISPSLLFIILGFSILAILLFLSYFIRSSISLGQKLKIYSIYDTISFCFVTINLILFIILFIFVPTEVSGSSMQESFYNKDKLLVWHIGYSPKRDDVVIIDVNEHYSFRKEETFFIKRVVAQEGDKVSFIDGVFYVNDTKVSTAVNNIQFKTMTSYESKSILENGILKKGFSIVMGDNRYNSIDSRYIGAINNDDIEGKVIFRYYSKEGNFGFPKKKIKE